MNFQNWTLTLEESVETLLLRHAVERGQLQAREHVRRERRAYNVDGRRGAEDEADGELGVVLKQGAGQRGVGTCGSALQDPSRHPPGSPTMHPFLNI